MLGWICWKALRISWGPSFHGSWNCIAGVYVFFSSSRCRFQGGAKCSFGWMCFCFLKKRKTIRHVMLFNYLYVGIPSRRRFIKHCFSRLEKWVFFRVVKCTVHGCDLHGFGLGFQHFVFPFFGRKSKFRRQLSSFHFNVVGCFASRIILTTCGDCNKSNVRILSWTNRNFMECHTPPEV